jgi:hypothetical protein
MAFFLFNKAANEGFHCPAPDCIVYYFLLLE